MDHRPSPGVLRSSAHSSPPNTDRTGTAAGDILGGKYIVDRVIGDGGVTLVVAARHKDNGTSVAIKIVRSSDPETHEQFRRHAQALASLESPHIVRVIEIGETDAGLPTMVMELLDGQDLASLLVESGPVTTDDAVRWMMQACEAVAEAHEAQILHGDLKPQNLFLTQPDSIIRVLDFGITMPFPRLDESEMRLTKPGDVAGTSYFLAPEQIRGRKLDARTDVWGAGACLFRLLTNHYPFPGDNLADVAAGIATLRCADMRTFRSDIPSPLSDIVTRCLQKNPRDRFQSMAEMQSALRDVHHQYSSIRNTPVVAVVQRVLEELRPTPHMQKAAAKIAEGDLLPVEAFRPTPKTVRLGPRPSSIMNETATAIRSAEETATIIREAEERKSEERKSEERKSEERESQTNIFVEKNPPASILASEGDIESIDSLSEDATTGAGTRARDSARDSATNIFVDKSKDTNKDNEKNAPSSRDSATNIFVDKKSSAALTASPSTLASLEETATTIREPEATSDRDDAAATIQIPEQYKPPTTKPRDAPPPKVAAPPAEQILRLLELPPVIVGARVKPEPRGPLMDQHAPVLIESSPDLATSMKAPPTVAAGVAPVAPVAPIAALAAAVAPPPAFRARHDSIEPEATRVRELSAPAFNSNNNNNNSNSNSYGISNSAPPPPTNAQPPFRSALAASPFIMSAPLPAAAASPSMRVQEAPRRSPLGLIFGLLFLSAVLGGLGFLYATKRPPFRNFHLTAAATPKPKATATPPSSVAAAASPSTVPSSTPPVSPSASIAASVTTPTTASVPPVAPPPPPPPPVAEPAPTQTVATPTPTPAPTPAPTPRVRPRPTATATAAAPATPTASAKPLDGNPYEPTPWSSSRGGSSSPPSGGDDVLNKRK